MISTSGFGLRNARQIGGPRPRVQFGQQRVIQRIVPSSCATRLSGVVDVAEDDRLGGAGGLAGGHDLAVADAAVLASRPRSARG